LGFGERGREEGFVGKEGGERRTGRREGGGGEVGVAGAMGGGEGGRGRGFVRDDCRWRRSAGEKGTRLSELRLRLLGGRGGGERSGGRGHGVAHLRTSDTRTGGGGRV
jgi:hypothetical protein